MEMFRIFFLNRLYLKYSESHFNIVDAKNFISKNHRIPKRFSLAILFTLVEEGYLIKEKSKLRIDKSKFKFIEEELEKKYLESNKLILKHSLLD
ncbi:MAG TPA: hypothetical protein VJ895_02695 [Candidatus Nanoarchaeia archaeon]|nr:hypothetical protein [Candidatus Nanoarchaeia archaeon]